MARNFMTPVEPTTSYRATPSPSAMSMAAWNQQSPIGASNFMTSAKLNSGSSISTGINNYGGESAADFSVPNISGDTVKPPPDKLGGWSDKNGLGGMALGAAEVGLGVYNALEQSKMNKFMRSYYGDQMDMMQADYTNNARSANEALSSRQQRIMSAQGIDPNSAEGKQGVAGYMDQWGAQETV